MAKLKAAATFERGLSEVVDIWLLQERAGGAGRRDNSCSPDRIKAGAATKLKAVKKWQEARGGRMFQELVKDAMAAGGPTGTTPMPQPKPISPPGPTSAEIAQMPFWKRAKMLKALSLSGVSGDAGIQPSERSKSWPPKPPPLPNAKTKGEPSAAPSQRSMSAVRASSFRSSTKSESFPPTSQRSGRSPRSTPRGSSVNATSARKSRAGRENAS